MTLAFTTLLKLPLDLRVVHLYARMPQVQRFDPPAGESAPPAAAPTAITTSTSAAASTPAATTNSAAAVSFADLSNRSLASVPRSVLLASLRSLDMSRNELTSLPLQLCGLSRLEHLDLRHNRLTSLPTGLGAAQPRLQLFVTNNPALAFELPPRAASGLFRDSEFPATAASLFRDPSAPWPGHPSPNGGGVRWLRPHEICAAVGAEPPRLFVDASDSSDVVQGLLGDCWLLSAIAVIAPRPELLQHVFAFSAVSNGRSGSFSAQLWVRGRWERVTVDDRLPCDAHGALLYAHSLTPNEFWVPLLEKCFAKLFGGYEALISGFSDTALRDLTGGAPLRLNLRDPALEAEARGGVGGVVGAASTGGRGGEGGEGGGEVPSTAAAAAAVTASEGGRAPRSLSALWKALGTWHSEGCPIGCAFSLSSKQPAAAPGERPEASSARGILRGHAYGVERLAEVGGRRLLRLRNPWGFGEWNGAWSDGSREWSAELLLRLEYEFEDDGERRLLSPWRASMPSDVL